MEAKDLLNKLEEYAGVDFRAHRKIAEQVVQEFADELRYRPLSVGPVLGPFTVEGDLGRGSDLPSVADLDAVAAEDEIKERS